ncbi:unnamed protein product, partial [Pleuronectes platessa]
MTVKHLLGPCGVWGTGALLGAQYGAQWGAKEAVVWTHIRPSSFNLKDSLVRPLPKVLEARGWYQSIRSTPLELFWGPNHLRGPNHGGQEQWSGHTSGPSSFSLKGALLGAQSSLLGAQSWGARSQWSGHTSGPSSFNLK